MKREVHQTDDEALLDSSFSELVSALLEVRRQEIEAKCGAGMRFLVKRILQYRIEIRPKEQGHNLAHFHVASPDYEGSYRIDNQQLIVGNIPRKHEKLVQIWALENRTLLEKHWNRAHPVSLENSREVFE
jgi:hypothetical protein